MHAAPSASSEAGRKEEAKKHFEAGRDLDAKGDVPGALREFLASRSLFKTRGNTLNAALALRKLGRIGEALEMLEAYLKDFENLSAEDKAMVEGELNATAQFVGKLAVDSSTSGYVIVDGIVRGKIPQTEPLRLAAGSHVVRIQPEAFAARPFETTLSIVSQQTVQLKPEFSELRDHGGLNVKAADGGTFDVLLDGAVVGSTPLSLQVVPRDYTVSLRAADGTGSAPTRASITSGRVHEMSLTTTKLDAQVDFQVDPPDAVVFLDGVQVGRGSWRGATTRGQHDFRAEAPGFTPRTLRATLAAPDQSLSLELQRGGGDDAATGAKGARTGFGGFAELDLGVSLGLLAGGHIRGECQGNCSSSLPFGPRGALRGGITIDKRFELGTELTFLHMAEHIEQRNDSVSVVGRNTPAFGISNDVVKWSSIGMGAVGGVRLGPEKTPITLRLAAGVMVGSVSDRRNGTFDTTAPELAQATRTVQAATHFYLAPEVRAGYAFTDHLSAGIGVRGTFAFDLSVPRWDTRRPTVLERSGLAYWDGGAGSGRAGERIMGGVRVLLDPSVYVRYDF